MNIDVIWYFDKAKWIFPKWRDGLRAAFEHIEQDHNVRWHLGTSPDIPEDSDFILNWDNSTSEFIPELKKYKARKGLVLTTDLGLDVESLRAYDVIFPEAQVVADKIKPHGIRTIKAFGTDDSYFCPLPHQRKVYEAFYPATFSPWKRQDLFSDIYGDGGLLLGTVQPDGWDILKHCIEKKSLIHLGYYEISTIRDLYNQAEKVHVTGWEGSGRTVLESLSCGVPVEVAEDNHKCQEYMREWRESGLPPRSFIKKNYSAKIYAEQLMKGISDA